MMNTIYIYRIYRLWSVVLAERNKKVQEKKTSHPHLCSASFKRYTHSYVYLAIIGYGQYISNIYYIVQFFFLSIFALLFTIYIYVMLCVVYDYNNLKKVYIIVSIIYLHIMQIYNYKLVSISSARRPPSHIFLHARCSHSGRRRRHFLLLIQL